MFAVDKLIGILVALALLAIPTHEILGQALRVITPPQGGTGIGSVTGADIGKCLKVLTNSPYTYELGTCGSGGGGGGSDLNFTWNQSTNELNTDGASTTATTSLKSNFFTATSTTINSNFIGFTATRSTTTAATSTNFFTSILNATTGFINSLTIGSLNGILKGTSGVVSTASNGTDYTLIAATTCGGTDKVSAISATGVITCSADVSGGGSGIGWATNTPSNVLYSTEGNHVVISASDKQSTTTNAVLQVWGGLSGDYFYATSSATSSFLTNLRTDNATITNATTTNLRASGAFSFGGIVGTAWTDFCTAITGGSSLCDGTDATGSGSVSTSTVPAAGNLAYWTSGSALSDVATGTLTETATGLSLSATRGLVGGASVLSVDAGYFLASTSDFTRINQAWASSTGLSATTPLQYAGTTGIFSILQAGTAQNGYLSSTDWNSFNGRVSSSSIDTLAELETLMSGINIIASTEIDTSSELAGIITDEIGTGNLVFNGSPSFTGTIGFVNATSSGSSTIQNLSMTNSTTTNATTTNLGVLSLNAASCDVKALTNGYLYCGLDASGSGGSSGGWSTTTDSNPETGEIVTYTSEDVYIGGAASTTAEFNFDVEAARFTLSSTTANATGSIFSQAGALKFGSSTGEQVELNFNLADTLRLFSSTGINAFDFGSLRASSTLSSTTALTIYGPLFDRTSSAGTNGMVLQTNGSGVTWVATSSLGITGGAGGTQDWIRNTALDGLTPTTTTLGLVINGSSTISLLSGTNATITNATTTNLSVGTFFALGADKLLDITGTGLQVTSNALTLNATGDWTGTLDGFEGSVLGQTNWLYNGSRLSPSTTVGIGVFASSTVSELNFTNATGTNATTSVFFSTSTRAINALFTNATTTSLNINSEAFTDLTGNGLTLTTNALTCATGSGSVFGCLPIADWTSFNGRVSSSSIDTLAELETLMSGINIIASTEIDTSSELAGIITDETGGAGSAVFSIGPSFTGTPTFQNIFMLTTGTSTLGYASTTALTVTNNAYLNTFTANAGTTTSASSTNLFATNASTSVLTVGNTFRLFGGSVTTNNALCIQLTGDAGLCDGNDATGAGGSPDWVKNLALDGLSPTSSVGIVITAASSTITGLSMVNSTTTNATSTNSFATNASTSAFTAGVSLNLFGGGIKTTANALCIQLTGSAALCDGADATGGAGSATGTTLVCATGCDYSSIQTAIDAGVRNIQLKEETYAGPVLIKFTDTKITGAGATSTMITCDGAVNSPCVAIATTTRLTRIILRDFGIDNTNVSFVGTGLDTSDTSKVYTQNIRSQEFNIAHLYQDTTNSSFYSHFENMDYYASSSCFKTGGTLANDNSIETARCIVTAPNGIGYGFYNAEGWLLSNINAEPGSVLGTGLYIDGTSIGIKVQNPWFEVNATGTEIASGAYMTSIEGGRITGGTLGVYDAGISTKIDGTLISANTTNFRSPATVPTTLFNVFSTYSAPSLLMGTNTPASTDNRIALGISSSNADANILVLNNYGAFATSPSAIKFDNSSGVFASGTARIYVNPGTGFTNAKMTFAVADSAKALQDRMVLDVNGFMGIGSTTPGYKLTLQGGNAYFGGNITATGTASTSLLVVDNSINLFGGGAKTTANDLCIQLTGSSALCDGADATGAGGTPDWVKNAAADGLTPTSTVGIVINASSTIGNGLQGGGLSINGGASSTWFYASTSIFVGSSSPLTNSLFSVGTATSIFNINRDGRVGFGCSNSSPAKYIFGCGNNPNVNPNIFFGVTDAADARMGVFVADRGVFMKSLTGTAASGIYGYNYDLGTGRNLVLQEFGASVGIGTTTPAGLLAIQPLTYTAGDLLMNVATGTAELGAMFRMFGTTTLSVNATSSTEIVNGLRAIFGATPSFLKQSLTSSAVYTNGINDESFMRFKCDGGIQSFAPTTEASAGHVCGDAQYWEDGAGTAAITTMTVTPMTYDSMALSDATAGGGSGFFFSGTNARDTIASSTPRLDGLIVAVSGASTTIYAGYGNTAPGGTAYDAMPTAFVGFIATSTYNNWTATVRTSATASTSVDTGVSSTTPLFFSVQTDAGYAYLWYGTSTLSRRLAMPPTSIQAIVTTQLAAGVYMGRVLGGSTANQVNIQYMEYWKRKPYMHFNY